MSYADSWGGHLSREVQFRCKICPDGVGGVADVACADAWNADARGYPSFEEKDGVSLVVARTAAGEALMRGAMAAGVVAASPLDVDRIEAMQPGQSRRKRLVRARVAALAMTLQPRPDFSGVMAGEAAKRASIGERLRDTLGTIRRVINGRRSRL
jgi:coenzyme F420 hydrogenase subunit beta